MTYRNAYSPRREGPSRAYRSSYGGVGSSRLGMGPATRAPTSAGGFLGSPQRGPFRPIPLPRGRSVPAVPAALRNAVSRAGGSRGAAAYYLVRYGLFGPWLDEEYGEITGNPNPDYYPDAADGWVLLCQSVPPPSENLRKVGVNPPALVGSGTVVSGTCNVSAVNRANAPDQVTIPATATRFQRVASTQPFPNQNGRPFLIYTNPGGSTVPVVYGPQVRTLPMDMGTPAPDTFTKMQPHPKPGGGVAGVYTPGINRGIEFTRGRIRPSGPHRPVPPGRGEREKKVEVNLPRGMASVTRKFHSLTEVQDAANCLFGALPKAAQGGAFGAPGAGLTGPGKGIGLHEKMYRVFANWNHIDWEKAITCLVANEVEDRVVGGLLGKSGKAFTKAYGKRPGPLNPRGVGVRTPR